MHANTPLNRFLAERRNLEEVTKLQDRHLVKLVTAYKHGNSFNLVFPLAKSNLHRYLREPSNQPYLSGRSFSCNPLWSQMLGLAGALYKLQHFVGSSHPQGPARYGFHFDLKPENILVDDDEHLIITDFGQAVFKLAKDTTNSRVVGMGGTEAYAPPELAKNYQGLNRKYDVWSLGCIFLEILTFITSGRDGLEQLDQRRGPSAQETKHGDDSFFERDERTGVARLKPDIEHYVESLQNSDSLRSDLHRDLFAKVHGLILQMLVPDRDRRIDSEGVYNHLKDVVDNPECNLAVPFDSSQVEPDQIAPGRELSKDLLQGLRRLDFTIDGKQENGSIRITEDGSTLTIQNMSDQHSSPVLLGERSDLRMLPEYASCPREGDSQRKLLLHLKSASSGSVANLCTFDLGDNSTACTVLQEVLLAQRVVLSTSLQAANGTPYRRNVFKKVWKRMRSSTIETEAFGAPGQAKTVQLWRTSACVNAHKTEGHVHSHSASQNDPSPPTVRIVVFYEHCICMIRIAENVRFGKGIDHAQHILTLEPTQERVDPSFPVHVFRDDNSSPAVPLQSEDLDSGATSKSQEFCSFRMHFASSEKARSFYESYISLKKEWTKERKKVEGHDRGQRYAAI